MIKSAISVVKNMVDFLFCVLAQLVLNTLNIPILSWHIAFFEPMESHLLLSSFEFSAVLLWDESHHL